MNKNITVASFMTNTISYNDAHITTVDFERELIPQINPNNSAFDLQEFTIFLMRIKRMLNRSARNSFYTLGWNHLSLRLAPNIVMEVNRSTTSTASQFGVFDTKAQTGFSVELNSESRASAFQTFHNILRRDEDASGIKVDLSGNIPGEFYDILEDYTIECD